MVDAVEDERVEEEEVPRRANEGILNKERSNISSEFIVMFVVGRWVGSWRMVAFC